MIDVLIVEDNEGIVVGLKFALEQKDMKVTALGSVKATKGYLGLNVPDIVILDVSLPDGNGFALYESCIKAKGIPTIFLTARDTEDDIVKGLELGADDYMTKPFSTRELVARVSRIATKNAGNHTKTIEGVTFDFDKMEAGVAGEKVQLTSIELKLLNLLFSNVNRVVTRDIIIESIWNWTGNDVNDNTVTVYMKRLRAKLPEKLIQTIKGVGYRIDEKK